MGILLRPNGIPVYGLLSYLKAHEDEFGSLAGKKILDCGAGGGAPPISIFHEHGLDCYGLEVDADQLRLAEEYCAENELPVQLGLSDMREIPFEANSFDIVYEHYSMCHLSKHDTRTALQEMKRVLVPGGICFMGVISEETWPRIGTEVNPGEFCAEEHGAVALHSFFSDSEAEEIVADWQVLKKEKIIRWDEKYWKALSREEWQKKYELGVCGYSRPEWDDLYALRSEKARYSHIYFILKK